MTAPNKRIFRVAILAAFLIFAGLMIFPVRAPAQKPTETADQPAAGSTVESGATYGPPGLPEGVVEVSQLFGEADQTEAQAVQLVKTADVVLPEMLLVDKIKAQIEASTDKLDRTPRNAILVQDLDIKISEAKNLIADLNNQSKQISADLAGIQDAQKQLGLLQAKWKTTKDAYQQAGYSDAPAERIAAVLLKLEAGRLDLEKKTKPLLEAQGRINDARGLIEQHQDLLLALKRDLTGALWEKDQDSFLEAGFYSQARNQQEQGFADQIKEYRDDLVVYSETAINRIVLELLALLGLWLVLRKVLAHIHEQTEKIPHLDELRALFKNSFAIALLLICLPLPLIHPNAPLAARELYLLVLVFPVMIILIRLIANRAYNFFILGMGLCYLLGLVRSLMMSLPPLDRMVNILQTLVGLMVVLMALSYLKVGEEDEGPQARSFRRVRLALRGLIAIQAGTLLSQIMGYNRAAVFFGQGALRTIYISLALVACYRLVRSLAIYSLYSRAIQRIRIIDHHRPALIEGLGRWLAMLSGLIWVYLFLEVWGISEPLFQAASRVWSAGVSAGENRVTVGTGILSGLALYVAILVSRLVALALEEEIYPRSSINTGLQNAITQVIRYALYFIGFVAALGLLGVRLQSLAIIAGALGVGIGFGLQAIVNNFVSGIILLIERPIKLGDVLEVNGIWAVVRHIGIRATVIETWDQSEIIVPNGDILDSRIVNWTRSGETNRITIQVGVAYGSDPNRVIEILKTAALDHPEVLNTPEPSIFFMGFGESSLDFEVRFHIPHIDGRLRVASEMRVVIYEALNDAGITIPFPQRDLWIRRETPKEPS